MSSGNIVKAGVVALLFALVFVLGAQILSLASQSSKAGKDFAEMQNKLDQARADQNKFSADLEYYLNPENLKKELKGRFNYKEPGEKMLILVNKDGTSTPTSSPR